MISSPSRVQVSLGLGRPLTGHLIRTVLLVRAVMLSPTLTVTGVVSLTGISLPFLGTSIDGFAGTVQLRRIVYIVETPFRTCLDTH